MSFAAVALDTALRELAAHSPVNRAAADDFAIPARKHGLLVVAERVHIGDKGIDLAFVGPPQYSNESEPGCARRPAGEPPRKRPDRLHAGRARGISDPPA